MSKTLRTAALVVGAVALVATGVGALAAPGVLSAAGVSAVAGVSVSTIGTIGTLASVGAGVLGLAASLTAKKPKSSLGGDQTKFTANKDQGLPYPMGRTSVSGFIAHRQTHGAKNVYQTFFAVLAAAGPIENVEAFKIDGQTVTFSGGVASGAAVGADYAGWMWLASQKGQTPEAAALASPVGAVPGWDASSKLSGYAAYALTLKYDDKGKVFAAGVPEPSVVLYGVKAYDPRWDSTYPGGDGPCRANDESTWRYTDNAFLHGLTWLIGRHQNGKRVMGVGAPITGIDVPAYVEACNIALANGWKMGGVVYSTDEKWAALKAMLQAGGGAPCRIGATISCTINAPRVSLDTIRSPDLVGEASVAGTQSRRERINAVVPRYRSEAHGWEMVPAALVKVDAYIAEDGGRRTKEIEFPLVQDAKLAAELAAYEIVDAREFGPITLPLKPRWVGYKPGDCLTIEVPELNMIGQTAIVLNRSLDPSTGIVTLTLRSETSAKHDFALGRTATPPPTPSLQVIDPSQLLIPGISAVWDAIADPNGKKPDDNADVTGQNTALNTLNVANKAATLVAEAVEQVSTITGTGPGSINYAINGVVVNLTEQVAAGKAEQKLVTDALSLQVGIRRNLIANGGLERGLEGITLPAGQGFAKGENPMWGPILVSSTASGTGAVLFPRFAAQAGQHHVIAADFTLVASAGEAYVDIIYTDAAGAPLPGGDGPQKSRATPFQFSEGGAGRDASAIESVAPAGTVWAQPRFVYQGVSGLTVVAVRQVKAELGSLPWTAYSTADQTFQNTLADITTTRQLIAGVDGGLAQLGTNLGVTFQNPGGYGATAIGQVSDLALTVATANLAASQRTSLVEASIGAERTGSPNLVRNGDARAGMAGVGVNAAGFVPITHPSLGTLFQKAGASAGDVLFWDVDVTPGDVMSISADMGFNPSDAGIAYVRFLAGGSYFGDPAGTFRSESWQRAGGQPFTVPAGVTALRILIQATKPCDFGVTRVQLQRGAWTSYRSDADMRDLTASATITQAAIADIYGRVQSYVRLTTVAGASSAELTILSDAAAGSLILLRADKFAVEGGVVIDGTLTARQIEANGLIKRNTVTIGAGVAGGQGVVSVLTYTMRLDDLAEVQVQAVCSQSYSAGSPSYAGILTINGVQVASAGGGAGGQTTNFSLLAGVTRPAGDYVVVMAWEGGASGITLDRATMTVDRAYVGGV